MHQYQYCRPPPTCLRVALLIIIIFLQFRWGEAIILCWGVVCDLNHAGIFDIVYLSIYGPFFEGLTIVEGRCLLSNAMRVLVYCVECMCEEHGKF